MRSFYFLLLLIVIVGACDNKSSGNRVIRSDIPFRVDGYLEFLKPDSTIIERIAIEIAASDSAQARGLMNRRKLHAKAGMLFINNSSEIRNFWMKNTPVSLDIIFLDSTNHIINIGTSTKPFSEDRVTSTAPARNIVEVNAHFSAQHHLDSTVWVRWKQSKKP